MTGYVLALLDAACQPLAGLHTELVTRERLLEQVPALRARDLTKRFSQEQMVAEHLADRLDVSIDEDVRPRWWAGVAFAAFRGRLPYLAHPGRSTVRAPPNGRPPAPRRRCRHTCAAQTPTWAVGGSRKLIPRHRWARRTVAGEGGTAPRPLLHVLLRFGRAPRP